jgi:ribosomal protein S18 acetylase RimI-like enzyme
MLAARDHGELVGFQQGFPSLEREGVYFLWQIGVRRGSRMEGLAGELVRETHRLARRAGCTAVQATVDVRNVPSRSLFTSLGYRNASFGETVEIDGERAMPDYYGSGTDQVLFQKEL